VSRKMKRERICFVIRRLAGRGGGAERVLMDVANEMHSRGYEVQIVTYEPTRTPPFYTPAFGVRVVNLRVPDGSRSPIKRRLDRLRRNTVKNLPYWAGLRALAWYSEHYGFARALRRHFESWRPDTVVAWMPPTYAPCAMAKRGLPIRLVASTHNEPSQDYTNPERWDPNPLDREKRLRALYGFDAVAVLLPDYQKWYDELVRNKIVIIPNAVRPVRSLDLENAPRKTKILSVGRLAKVKRHDLSILAFHRIASRHPNWNFEIFGSGPEEANLRSMIRELGLENRVYLRGHVVEIQSQYTDSSFLCHSAEFEGFPLAVTESLASGLPVVGFDDCSGLNQLVVHEYNGVLVKPGSDRVTNLAAAIERMITDHELRIKCSRSAPGSMTRFHPTLVFDLWEHFITGCEEAKVPQVKDFSRATYVAI